MNSVSCRWASQLHLPLCNVSWIASLHLIVNTRKVLLMILPFILVPSLKILCTFVLFCVPLLSINSLSALRNQNLHNEKFVILATKFQGKVLSLTARLLLPFVIFLHLTTKNSHPRSVYLHYF